MLEKYFKVLDEYRNNVTGCVDINVIEEKQKELKVEFPLEFVEFYTHFGNDEEVLSSFYIFDKIEDIEIEYDALCFGEKHEGIGRLGILLEDLKSVDEAVSWYSYDAKKWYIEESEIATFLFSVSAWQVLNTMPSLAMLCLSEEEFKNMVGSDLEYLSEEEILMLGDVIPVVGKGVLGCYMVETEELYLGAKNDEILEKYDEIFGDELDWL